MKYLCLLYGEERTLEALPHAEAEALTRDSLGYDEKLRQRGHLIAAHALHSTRAAKTVRVRNGKAFVTDGPFAEAKEQLVKFMLVEARDLDEAVRLASNDRMASMGGIEVRPILDLVAQ